MSNPNFLILDEPTNDLDIFVMSVLEDYLRNFQGCLIVVSHDRYFMDKMVDHLFVFEGQGKVRDIVGNYTDFRKAQQVEKRETKLEVKISLMEKEVVPEVETKRKLSFKEKEEFKQLENELGELELRKEQLSNELSTGIYTGEELVSKGEELGNVISLLEEKSDRWLILSEYL